MSKPTANPIKIIKRLKQWNKSKKECYFSSKGIRCFCCTTNPFTVLQTILYGDENNEQA